MYTERYTAARTDPAMAPTSLSARVYADLKRGLLAGDYPLGSRLAEASLGERVGASRTPVRDALTRLHVEGLVVRLPEGGFSPAAPDLHTVSELYEVRRHLEFGALRRHDHDRARLLALREDWGALTAPDDDESCGPDFVLVDEDFHLGLAEAAGNHTLVTMLTSVNERIRAVRMHDFLTADRVARTIEEHLGIVDALLAGEPGPAADRLSSHLEISERVVAERAAVALSRMLSGGAT